MRTGLVLLMCACGVSEEVYNARVADLNRTKTDLDRSKLEHKACADYTTALKQNNAALRSHIEATGADVTRLQENLEATRRQFDELRRLHELAQKSAQTYRDLVAKLKAMIDAGHLSVETRDGRMLVKLPDAILFDSGKATIKPAGAAALKQLAEVLAQIADRNFQVAGHTDNAPVRGGRFKSNWELSTARAVEVVRFLGEAGVASDRLSAAGYGEFDPVAPNDTTEGRAKNRRIEIVLQPNIEELPKLID